MNPTLVRQVIYPWHERLVGRPTFSMLAELERSQYLSRAEIEQLQMVRLKGLLQIAERHCPWHARRIREAELDLRAGAPAPTLEQLRRLPTMTRSDATLSVDDMVWRGVPGGAYKYNTGGSSGQPLVFFYGRGRQASDAAGRMRARRWWGVEIGEREVYLWGAPVELSKTDRIKTLRDRFLNQLMLNAFDMSPARMDEYIDAVMRYRPRCIYGYASSVALLAAHAQRRGIEMKLPDLKVVCVTGEPLYPHQRALIGEVFDAPVANEFGSRDIGFTAHETPDGQMLLLSENLILEVLDKQGRPLTPGEEGEAVITGLCSEAQPFIRYRTGDVVRHDPDASGGRRGLHVIGAVTGRSTDFVVRADGTIMHALALIYVLRAVQGVAEFKLIQQTVRELSVLVVANRYWSEASREAIVSGLCARLGEDVRVDVRQVEGIAPEASGKFRYVVSHVRLDPDLARAGVPAMT